MDPLIICLLTAGLLTGFSKMSVGGMGLLILPVVMIAFPGPEALGMIVPMYVITDIVAITMYRKDISWPVLVRILPLAFTGLVLGGWLISDINAQQFSIMLGITVMALLGLGIWLDYKPAKFMQQPLIAYGMGFSAGFISLSANAAGPLLSLFLLQQNLSKTSYVSTRAWFFLIVNLAKIPLLWQLELMTSESVKLSLYCLPGLALGTLTGYLLIQKIQLTQFKWLIRLMACIAAIKLLGFS